MNDGLRSRSEREQREWEAQELAVHEERAGVRAASDATVNQYRLLARVLRNSPLAPLPSDFAARTAERARVLRAAGEAVEIWLERGLVAVLLLGGAAALLVYNGDWLRELDFSVPDGAALGIRSVLDWSVAVAACVGISSAFSLARKR